MTGQYANIYYDGIQEEDCQAGGKHDFAFGGVIKCFCTKCLKRFDLEDDTKLFF